MPYHFLTVEFDAGGRTIYMHDYLCDCKFFVIAVRLALVMSRFPIPPRPWALVPGPYIGTTDAHTDVPKAFDGVNIRLSGVKTDPFDNDKAVADTIAVMIEIVKAYGANPVVARAVRAATDTLPTVAIDRDVVRAIYYWIKSHIRFVEDEEILKRALGYEDLELDKELLITPDTLLSMPHPMGDCDDFSLLLATMCYSFGLPVWFVTIAADKMYPQKFSHVYVKVYLPDESKTEYLDASHGSYPGWEYKAAFRKQEWAVK